MIILNYGMTCFEKYVIVSMHIKMEPSMQASAHVEQLSHKHAKLDEELRMEMKRPTADALRISELKRQKLLLKDQISEHSKAG